MLLTASALTVTGQSSSPSSNKSISEQESLRKFDLGIMVAQLTPTLSGKNLKIMNVPLIADVLSDEYVRVDPNGKVSTKDDELKKSQNVEFYASRKSQIECLQVRIFEKTAIVRNLIKLEGHDENSVEREEQFYVTNIYTNQEGKWLQISSQWTVIKN